MNEAQAKSAETTRAKESVELSVLVSCYNEEATIARFHCRLEAALRSTGRTYEILYVNDGGRDATFTCLERILEECASVRVVVDLFHNAGQPGALTALLPYASGRRFVFLDSDLQLDPEELPLLLEKADEGFDVVNGYRRNRKDPLRRRIPGFLAHRLMRRVSRCDLRDFGCNFRVVDARLIRAFEFGPFKPLLPPPLVYARTRRWAEVPVTHHARPHGRSGWSFEALVNYFLDNLLGVMRRPFQVLALGCALVALLVVLRLFAQLLVPYSLLDEVTNGLIANLQLFSLLSVLAVLCLIGEFVVRMFGRMQKTPAFIVRAVRERTPHRD